MPFSALIGGALVLLTALLLLRELRPGLRAAVAAAGGTLLALTALAAVLDALSGAIPRLREALPEGEIWLRCLGAGILSSSVASVCRDAGEEYLARSVEAVGRCAVLLFSLPLLRELIETCASLL